MNTLQTFENPFEVINVIKYDGQLSLEIGDEINYPSEDMSDDEIISWAEEEGYLDDEEDGYMDEDGNPLIENLRDLKRVHEEECLPTSSTPSGRAFLFFEGLDIPQNIKLDVIDGYHPGNDWQGVLVNSVDDIFQLQQYFFEQGSKVNFLFV